MNNKNSQEPKLVVNAANVSKQENQSKISKLPQKPHSKQGSISKTSEFKSKPGKNISWKQSTSSQHKGKEKFVKQGQVYKKKQTTERFSLFCE